MCRQNYVHVAESTRGEGGGGGGGGEEWECGIHSLLCLVYF